MMMMMMMRGDKKEGEEELVFPRMKDSTLRLKGCRR